MADKSDFMYVPGQGWYQKSTGRTLNQQEYLNATGASAKQQQQAATGRSYGSINPREGDRDSWNQATYSGAFNEGKDVIYDNYGNPIGHVAPDGIRPMQGGNIVQGHDYSKQALNAGIADAMQRNPNMATAGGTKLSGIPFATQNKNFDWRPYMQAQNPTGLGGPFAPLSMSREHIRQANRDKFAAAQQNAPPMTGQMPSRKAVSMPMPGQNPMAATGGFNPLRQAQSVASQGFTNNFTPPQHASRQVNNPQGAMMAAQAAALRGM